MNVLHVLETLDPHPGLFAAALPGMLSALAQGGIQCNVVAGASHDILERDRLLAESITLVDERNPEAALSNVAPAVNAADVVHIHSADAEVARVAAAACRATGTPYILSPYGDLLRDLGRRGRLSIWFENRRIEKKFAARAWLHCIHEREQQLLQRRRIAGPYTVIPVGFGSDGLDRLPAPTASPATLPWPDEMRVILYLGDFDDASGLAQFFRACDELELELETWRIVIAGRPIGNWLELCKAAARRHGKTHLGEFIVYPDLHQQRALIERAELIVLPALIPVPPIAAIWAMIHRRPVLVSNTLGLDEVAERNAGAVVDPSRKGILAGLGPLVTAAPRELARMGQAAHELAAEKLGWSAVIPHYAELYADLARK